MDWREIKGASTKRLFTGRTSVFSVNLGGGGSSEIFCDILQVIKV